MRALKFVLALGTSTSANIACDTFDYVVIGGGTAGLTVAARLSENANTTVLVLEAGEDRSEDINILAPGLLTSLYGDDRYDWNYHTVPQKHLNNHAIAHPRGKQLGGSSAINFLWWTHASQQDIDKWGLLGNKNWGWEALQPLFAKSEHYLQPSAETAEALDTDYIEPDLHGKTGPIETTFADIYEPLDEAWPRTYGTLGLAVDGDPRNGIALGGYTNLLNMDLKTRSRSYAVTTYLQDARPRNNFHVLTGAHAQRILFDHARDQPRVSGVTYIRNGTSHTVHARREVVLCAGAFGSPQLLELSGIGNTRLLEKHGIKQVVENENVGEGLQDHVYVPLGYKVRPGIFTLDDFANDTLFNEAYEQYVANRTGLLATTSAMSALLSLEQIDAHEYPGLQEIIEEYCSRPITNRSNDEHALQDVQQRKQSLLCADIHNEAIMQEFAVPGGMSWQEANDTTKLFAANTAGNFFTITAVLEHPYSYGSVHITSANGSEHPAIDPRYLSHPLDTKLLAAAALHLQEVVQTSPLSALLESNGTMYHPSYHKLDTVNAEA